MKRLLFLPLAVVLFHGHAVLQQLRADEPELAAEARGALRRSVEFFRRQVTIRGAYVWAYSSDLKLREGEGPATATMGWVQPPGTPSVGFAFLDAHQRTGADYYRDAAIETALALVDTQLRSGGWDYRIEFDPNERSRYAYRVDADKPDAKRSRRKNNVTTFDDNNTQHAMRLLMRVDQATQFKNERIHEAVEYGLAALMKAQYPNGAWPQRYDVFPDPKEFPVKRASYPESWSRTYPGAKYRAFYTFNDNAIADVIDVMFTAAEIYGNDDYRRSAEKAGGFILLAQMPEPQPAWAQQYDIDMHPAWARKFEPASVTGGESQGVLRTLLHLYRETGDKKYLEPIPRAVDYLQRSHLPDGRLARFYELKTNRPLFFTKAYQLTYSDADMPTHYAFKTDDRSGRILREYERLLRTDPSKLQRDRRQGTPRLTRDLENRARAVIGDLDERGAWLERGSLRRQSSDHGTGSIIRTRTFIRNVDVLSEYLAAVKASAETRK